MSDNATPSDAQVEYPFTLVEVHTNPNADVQSVRDALSGLLRHLGFEPAWDGGALTISANYPKVLHTPSVKLL